MALVMTIENAEHLSGDMLATVRLAARSRLDIGRRQGVDWVLPDPDRFISGLHCEVRWIAGRFWLYDVSTNGTFVNRSRHPLKAPHPLAAGDRVAIGAYVLRVDAEPEAETRLAA